MDHKQILHIRTIKNAHVELNDAIDSFLLAKNLTNGQPSLILADLRAKKIIDPKALKLFKKQNTPHNQKAKAVLINSKVNKYLSNLFRSNQTKHPVKTFTSEKEAMDWLESFQ